MTTFTPRALSSFSTEKDKEYISDPETKNLKLVVRSSGSKTWVWRARVNGAVRAITLGAFQKFDMISARQWARSINARLDLGMDFEALVAASASEVTNDNSITLEGGDKEAFAPGDLKFDSAAIAHLPRVDILGKTQRVSDGEPCEKSCDWMFDLYMESEGNSRDSGPEKRRMYDRDIKPAVGHKSIFEVTYDDFADILSKKAKTAPIAANALQSLIRRWFRWACTIGRSDTGMRSQIDPTIDLIKLTKPRTRSRFLVDYEIAVFLRALEVTKTVMDDPWRLILLTGVRRDEAFGAPFDEFDLDRGEWLIPEERTKTATPLLLPLPPQACAIVRRAFEARQPGQTLLWPTNGRVDKRKPGQPDRPRSGFSKAVSITHAAMANIVAADKAHNKGFKLQPWSTHDLRRTLASGMNGLLDGNFRPLISSEVVERILNHKIGGVKGVYNQWAYYREKKVALEQWADHIDEVQEKHIERFRRYQPEGASI